MIKHCEVCEKEFITFPCFIKINKGKYCSNKCYGKWKSKQPSCNPKAYNGKNISCLQCKNCFYIAKYKIKKRDKHFCSKNCWYKWKSLNMLGNLASHWKGGFDKLKTKQKWIEKNRDYVNWTNAIRRALFKNAEGNFTFKEWKLLKKQCQYICLMCNKKEPKIKLTIDHIIPLSKKGSNWIKNIQPLCGSCNSKKGTRFIEAVKEKLE